MDIKIRPLETTDPQKLDELLDGEISGFEKWFMQRQRDRGAEYAGPLIAAERGIVKAYIMYAAQKDKT